MMILLQQNKKRRESGEKCHSRTVIHSKAINLSNEHTSCSTQADCCGNKSEDGIRRGGVRRELKKRGKGMKGRVDKSMGIVINSHSGGFLDFVLLLINKAKTK